MTKEELFEKMKPLADSLSNSLASKQHAFNSHRASVDECKKNGISNQLITDAINSHLKDDDKISLSYFKNLLVRSKGNNKGITSEYNPVRTISNKNLSNKRITSELTNNDSSKSDNVSYNIASLTEYMKVCFGSERIAKRAIEAGVSIEEIKSWRCPNQINLGTKLSGYIQNK
ncbi:hypothetical protein AH775_19095 [Salmonella enterica subsp. enterica serovar Give]|nr:hypothetical protein [Salmonella enterica subsp. enterica serovar Give]EGZ3892273.1 hypothetical protein [Salmonella enterica subsp. enterica serovar Bonn]